MMKKPYYKFKVLIQVTQQIRKYKNYYYRLNKI